MCCLALKRALTWSGAVTVHFETTSAEVIPVQRMKQRGVWRVPTFPGHRRRYWATARGADSHVPHNDHHKPRPTSKQALLLVVRSPAFAWAKVQFGSRHRPGDDGCGEPGRGLWGGTGAVG